jgi:hypothetical protein
MLNTEVEGVGTMPRLYPAIKVVGSVLIDDLIFLKLEHPPEIPFWNLPLFKASLKANEKLQSSLRRQVVYSRISYLYEVGLVVTFFSGLLGHANQNVYWGKAMQGLSAELFKGLYLLGKLKKS